MKKYITVLLIVVMALSFVACQETPEEVVAVKKDTERLLEQAAKLENGQMLNDLAIPEDNYIFNSEMEDGRLRIHVDAEVHKPDVGGMPIRKAAISVFTQE